MSEIKKKDIPNKASQDKDLAKEIIESLDLLNVRDEDIILTEDDIEKSSDKIIEEDPLGAVFEQDNRVVYFEIENVYKGDGKTFKGKNALKKSPPVLVFRDNIGNEAEFILTEELNRKLIRSLQQMERAYAGFSRPKDEKAPDGLFSKIKYYIKKHPIKVIIPIALIVVWIIVLTNR